jgi:hypothetical protein
MRTNELPFNPLILDRIEHLESHHAVRWTWIVLQYYDTGIRFSRFMWAPPANDSFQGGNRFVYLR